MPRANVRIAAIIIVTIAAQVGLSRTVNAVTEQEYALRCAKAQALCRGGGDKCEAWRQAFNDHRSVCPGVNAPPNAAMRGPPSTVSDSPYAALSGEQQSGTVSDLREMCSARWGWRGFINQTECVKRVVAKSDDSPDLGPSNPYIALYLLQANKLLEEVRQNRISEEDANIELQKTYLDVLARQSAANESRARLGAIQKEENDRERETAEAKAREQAAAQAAQAQRQQDEQTQTAALDRLRLQCKAAMVSRFTGNGIDMEGINKCDSDPYANLRQENQPKPITRTSCTSNGLNNGFICTSH